MIDWIILVVALATVLAGYGIFKVHPLLSTISGIVAGLIIVAVMISAVFGSTGFLAFFTASTAMLYVTVISTSFVVGSIVGALF